MPWLNNNNSPRLGPLWLARVMVLLVLIGTLTWYGKFRKPQFTPSRLHGFSTWIMQHQGKLSALVVLADDNNDANNQKTGLRIWFNPIAELPQRSGAIFAGKRLVLVGDSLDLALMEVASASVDSGGELLLLGRQLWSEKLLARTHSFGSVEIFNPYPNEPIQSLAPDSLGGSAIIPWLGDRVGSDVETRFDFGPNAEYTLDLRWDGYVVRIWSHLHRIKNVDSLSAGLILHCLNPTDTIPSLPQVRSLVWCATPGSTSLRDTSTTQGRLALQGQPAQGILFAQDHKWKKMVVKFMHLREMD